MTVNDMKCVGVRCLNTSGAASKFSLSFSLMLTGSYEGHAGVYA